MEFETTTYSVSELNSIVRGMLETRLGEVRIRGEISNLSQPASGHRYFTLKDDRAQIRCAFFKGRSMGMRFKPANGQEVVAIGRVSLYEARGEFQMIVERLEPFGEGQLQIEFEQLKKRLLAEGLFDQALKRPLPLFPKQLAIITSATGAALQDILHVLERRYPVLKILLYPVAVQGKPSESELITALKAADSRNDIDAILMTRGGGSIEDLWSFNSEALARLIVESQHPIITGIGHEIDFTIADFAADQRAPTPSAAAEMLTPDSQSLTDQIHAMQNRIAHNASRRLNLAGQRADQMHARLARSHPSRQLKQIAEKNAQMKKRLLVLKKRSLHDHQRTADQLERRLNISLSGIDMEKQNLRLVQLRRRLNQSVKDLHTPLQQRLSLAQRVISQLTPENTLARGYAIVRSADESTIIRQPQQLKAGEDMSILLASGSILATKKSSSQGDE